MKLILVFLLVASCCVALAQDCPRGSAEPSKYCVCEGQTYLVNDPHAEPGSSSQTNFEGCGCTDTGSFECNTCENREPISAECRCDADKGSFVNSVNGCECDPIGRTTCMCEVAPADPEQCQCVAVESNSMEYHFQPTENNQACCDASGSKVECDTPQPCAGQQAQSPNECECRENANGDTEFQNINPDASDCVCEPDTGLCVVVTGPCHDQEPVSPECQCSEDATHFVNGPNAVDCECDADSGECVGSAVPCGSDPKSPNQCECGPDGTFVNINPDEACVCNPETGLCEDVAAPCNGQDPISPECQCADDGSGFVNGPNAFNCECDADTGECIETAVPCGSDPESPNQCECGPDGTFVNINPDEACICNPETGLCEDDVAPCNGQDPISPECECADDGSGFVNGPNAFNCECDADTGKCVEFVAPCDGQPPKSDFCVCDPDTNSFVNSDASVDCECDPDTGDCLQSFPCGAPPKDERCKCIDGVFQAPGTDCDCDAEGVLHCPNGPCEGMQAQSPNYCKCSDGVFVNIQSDATVVPDCECDRETGECIPKDPCAELQAESPDQCYCEAGQFYSVTDEADCFCTDSGAYKCDPHHPCEGVVAGDPKICFCSDAATVDGPVFVSELQNCECDNEGYAVGDGCGEPSPCDGVVAGSPKICFCSDAATVDGPVFVSELQNCECDNEGYAVGEGCEEEIPCGREAIEPYRCVCRDNVFVPAGGNAAGDVEQCGCTDAGKAIPCQTIDVCKDIIIREGCGCDPNSGVYSTSNRDDCFCEVFQNDNGVSVAEETCKGLCYFVDLAHGCGCDEATGLLFSEREDCYCEADASIYCPPTGVPIGCEPENAPSTVTDFESECDCKIIRTDNSGVHYGELLCETRPAGCDPDSRPHNGCWCNKIGLDSAGAVVYSWVCPQGCLGTPASDHCSCLEMPNSDALNNYQWWCPNDCADLPAPECANAQCITSADGNVAWECPIITCGDITAEDYPLECAKHSVVTYCRDGEYRIECEDKPCTCDNQSLPDISDFACDGEIEFVCEIDGSVVDAANVGADVVESSCAHLVPYCIEDDVVEPRVVCDIRSPCGYPECVNVAFATDSCSFNQDGAAIQEIGFSCEDQCLRNAHCGRVGQTGASSCGFTKSDDYENCLTLCHTPKNPVPTDKCSFITDACACSLIDECAVCAERVEFEGDAGEVKTQVINRCVSQNSDAICLLNGNTFTDRADGIADDCERVVGDVPVVLPVDPTPEELVQCLADARCNDSNDVNENIKNAVDDITAKYTIMVLLVVDSNLDNQLITLRIATIGDGAPVDLDLEPICNVVKAAIASSLDFDPAIVKACNLRRIVESGSTKRQTAASSTTTEYFADMELSSTPQSAATTSTVSLVVLLGALLIALF